MNKITYVTVLLLLVTQFSFSQEKIISKRIEIQNPSRAQLLQIKDAGFDLSCSAIFKDNKLILEVGQQELNELDSKNINYNVTIDDLIEYYKEKTERELPFAKMQLEQMKAKSATLKSLSTQSESIDNFIQYEGCSEVDWAVPTNFNLGSMAGCLTYSEMLAELDQMRALYPNLISAKTDASPTNQITHGNSYTNGGAYDSWAGQPIYYVRISDNPDTDESNEPESLYSGMTHSREVSSMMNLIYYMWYILENYDTDPGIKNLVDNHEMYFIPVANPDGLMWNEQVAPSGGGMQRKNLGPYNTGNNTLRGVDLNRNYDYFWGPNPIYDGSSSSVTSDTYRGPSAFSEPETEIVRDFSATRQFKTAMNHHATSNLIPHAYNGYPAAPASGREAEYHKFCQDMTRFNRYIYGEAPDILTIANGDMSDWMLGGVADVNGSTGSGQGILALAPENGAWDGSEGGFWPNSSDIVTIAQRAMRMNFANVYHSGKFAQFHDLNTTDITTTTGNFEFGIEYLGQTLGDITLNVTPVSSNITSITPPATQTGWSKLEQRTVTAAYTLDSGIQANESIEFQITLSNGDGYIMYQANIVKYYNPTILTVDNPDVTGISNWTTSGGTWGTTSDAYSGSTAITDSPSGAYTNNQNKTITYNTAVDLSSSTGAVVQYYAKWDLERNFDYVQIQGSTNGSTWTTLCGKYTKPGADYLTTRYSSTNSTNTSTGKSTSDQNNQPSGDLIYDADTMDKWVMEEIYIDATNNSSLFGASNVQFRFLFDSDNSNRADGYPTTFDGFIFDDFKVIEINIPCDDTNPPTGITVSNITTASAFLDWDIIPSATYDLRYRVVGFPFWTEGTDIATNSYSITGLTDSTNYEVQVRTRCVSTTSSYSTSSYFTTATPVPCSGSSISSYPYTETFDSGLGLWTQGVDDIPGTDYEDWTLNSGGTTSNGTGPTNDFTGGGNYLYTEASNANATTNVGPNNTVTLISPCIDLIGYENTIFSFYYHMFGTAVGSISVDVSIDNGSSWSQLNAAGNIVTNSPILSGQQQTNQTDPWLQQSIDLGNYSNQVIKLRFAGTTGTSFSSDMGIDQINITADTIILSAPPNAVCQNISVQLDATGNATIVAIDVDGGSSDDIAITNYSIDIDAFDCSDIGDVPVTLTVTDGEGQQDTCIATVTVEDIIDPTASNPTAVNVQCAADVPAADITVVTDEADNCTPTVAFVSDISDGNSNPEVITRTYSVTDQAGNSINVTQTITVNDTTDPDTPTLADVTGECTVTAVAPNTTDACAGTITGTTSDQLTYSTQGTYTITWNFDDGNGQSIDVTQNVVIDDITDPVPDSPTLADVTAECSVTSLTAPTATDNCSGTVTVTNDASLPITAQGTTIVTWTYDDGNGNTVDQTQNVVIDDITDPVPDSPTLADVTAECSVTSLTAPTATDNCSGTVTVTNDASLPITAQGTTIVTWTYDDGNGNTVDQTQNVVIDDITDPVPDSPTLADVTAECSVTSLTAPTATDNCSGTVTVTNDASLPITAQGTTIVTWTYDDGNGNTVDQTQNVVIDDITDPVPDSPTLADVTAECSVTSLTAPTATDNCSGTVTVTNDASLPITAQGTTIVTWTYDDGNGNTVDQTQNVVIDDITDPVPDSPTLADVTAECSVTSLTAPTATDNCSGTVTVTNDASLPITAQGTTIVTWTYDDGNGNTVDQTQNVVIDDITDPVPDSPTLADVTAECSVTSLTAPTATDNCSGTVTVTNDASLPITAQGTTYCNLDL